MKPAITNSRFSWCSDPEKSAMAFLYTEPDMPQTQYQIPAEIGEGWFRSIHLPMNMVIRRGVLHFKPDVAGKLLPVATIEERFWELVLCVQSAEKGRVVLLDHDQQKEFIFSHNNALFEHIAARNSLVRLDASDTIEMTTLIIGDSVLQQLLGEEEARTLLEALTVQSVPATRVQKVPHHINALFHSSISDQLTGHISKLYIQAKVLDYLCALSQYFVGAARNLKPESGIEARIHQMHDDLLQLKGKVPSLNELAATYDVPVRKLKEGFSALYGKSIFGYISEVRLQEAHATLANTDVAMKIIAINLGFSHVNHFISAFGRQFGYSPGSLRKKTEARYDTPLDDPA